MLQKSFWMDFIRGLSFRQLFDSHMELKEQDFEKDIISPN
jgi:hypothetical protein